MLRAMLKEMDKPGLVYARPGNTGHPGCSGLGPGQFGSLDSSGHSGSGLDGPGRQGSSSCLNLPGRSISPGSAGRPGCLGCSHCQ